MAEAGPHGPVPAAVRKSLMVPQVVSRFVTRPMDTDCRLPNEGMVKTIFVLTTPLALVTISLTLTLVRATEPQFDTTPEMVKEPVARSIEAGPQTLVTAM